MSRILISKEFRVGSALEELPWGSIDKETGEEMGAEVEIARLIAQKMGVRLVLVNKGFDYLIPELLNKQYDAVIAGLSVTEERLKKVNFSDPYLTTGLVIIVRSDNKMINKAGDLTGKKVGVLVDTTSHSYAQSLPGVEVRVYDEPGEYVKDTLNGKIDATIYDATFAHNTVKENPQLKIVDGLLKKEGYGIAVRKEDKALLREINKIVAEIKGSEELMAITSKWYGPVE
ncbi:amino acid ABC transporter substrate-binding protein [candidate division WWE3 bacterium]|nr:amino acid ABC transporter substrate-binding protein [candidate division WWE3 bacterium]